MPAERDSVARARELLKQIDCADLPRELALEALPERDAAADADFGLSAELYLRKVRVEGFRGIGPPAELDLDPRPGLTVVVGRNGSGKSSIAEALELLLTGDNHRWKGRAKVWREGWRNLHASGPTSIAATFTLAATGDEVEIRRVWPDDAGEVGDATVDARDVDGSPTTLEALGWPRYLRQMRPFLPYSELGSMFDQPRDIYDALMPILGLDDVEESWRGLRERRLAAERGERELRGESRELIDRARALDDARARALGELLTDKKLQPDDEKLVRLLAGDRRDDPQATARRQLAHAQVSTVQELRALLDEHAQARGRRVELAQTSAATDRALADLVERALNLRGDTGGEDCPVCGTPDVLDDGWAREAQQRVAALRERAAALDAADRDLQAVRERIATAIRAYTALRDLADRCDLDGEVLREAHAEWSAAWRDGEGEHDRAAMAAEKLVTAGARLTAAAAAAQQADDEQWRGLADAVARWRDEWRAHAQGPSAADLRAAEEALRDVLGRLRDERLAPIREGMRATWDELRQQSNVALEDIDLVRRGDQRTAVIDVRVDGNDAAALAVLSQGELNALALSAFLPRATLPESPFRFAVIDDPVQAMDPAKVDGLARVLHRHAEHRQIVVLTHDVRFPEALARLGLDATVIEVKRDTRSTVRLRRGRDLVVRYLDDARVCARDDALDPAVRVRVSLALCRSALDLAAERAVWRRWLRDGVGHDAISAELDRCQTTKSKLAAALRDPHDADGKLNLFTVLSERFGPKAVNTVQTVTRGAHGSLDGNVDLTSVIDGARQLSARLVSLGTP